jgi:hypothetical protein
MCRSSAESPSGAVVMTVRGVSLSRRRIVPSGAVATFTQFPSGPPLNDDFCQFSSGISASLEFVEEVLDQGQRILHGVCFGGQRYVDGGEGVSG